jgi:GTP:adenosylcobinamide-phosphate guanylyltransferase
VLDKLRSATDHLDELIGKLVQATTDMAEVVKSVRESGRRMEIATYVIVGLTIVQLFYIAFQFSAKH